MPKDNECCNCDAAIYIFGGAWVHRGSNSIRCDINGVSLAKEHVAVPRYHEDHNQMIMQFN